MCVLLRAAPYCEGGSKGASLESSDRARMSHPSEADRKWADAVERGGPLHARVVVVPRTHRLPPAKKQLIGVIMVVKYVVRQMGRGHYRNALRRIPRCHTLVSCVENHPPWGPGSPDGESRRKKAVSAFTSPVARNVASSRISNGSGCGCLAAGSVVFEFAPPVSRRARLSRPDGCQAPGKDFTLICMPPLKGRFSFQCVRDTCALGTEAC